MKLFILKPVTKFVGEYDVVEGMVVRAKSLNRARQIAAANAGDERGDFWRSHKTSSCKQLREVGQEGLILRDRQRRTT